MALHTNMSFTDPTAIYVGAMPSKKSMADAGQKSKKVDIIWDDETQSVAKESESKEKDHFSFLDMLDVVNPLQHIPIVSSIYRYFSGDDIKPAARVAGGALFGGPVGAAVSSVDAIIAHETGQYVGDRIFAGFMGGAQNISPMPEMPSDIQMAAMKTQSPMPEQMSTPTPSSSSQATMVETDSFDNEFLFDDFMSTEDRVAHDQKLAFARDQYLKSLNLGSEQGAQMSQLY